MLSDQFRATYKFLSFPSSPLWYLARAQDLKGCGRTIINLGKALPLLGIKRARLYQWLKEGQEVGFFRHYSVRGNFLYLWMGAKWRVCKYLGLQDMGATALVSLGEILGHSHELATEIAADLLQRKSIHAAKRQQTPSERKRYEVKNPLEIFNVEENRKSTFNDSTATRVNDLSVSCPYIIHDSGSRLFVGSGFIPVGGSQVGIAELTGQSDRTVRRHLAPVRKRQICQTKSEYKAIHQEMAHCDLDETTMTDYMGNCEKSRQRTTKQGQMFKMGNAYWLNRCNIYDLKFTFKSERRQRAEYKKRLGISTQFDIEAYEKAKGK